MGHEDDYADPDSRKFPLSFWSLLAIAVVVAMVSGVILIVALAPPIKENI
jgi:hypothetical protein